MINRKKRSWGKRLILPFLPDEQPLNCLRLSSDLDSLLYILIIKSTLSKLKILNATHTLKTIFPCHENLCVPVYVCASVCGFTYV